MASLPLVGMPGDTHESNGLYFHLLGDKYVRAVADVSKCLPVMIPSIGEALDIDAVLDHFDGFLITGAVSNVHPPHYGEEPSAEHEPYDHRRDATTLRLIKAVINRGIPLFCICRGFQELNVVLGGTLETELQKGEGRLDHRSRKVPDLDVRYGPSHRIDIRPGGMLERILGKREATINSVHRQGIRKLAPGLEVEATAPDGIIEAASVKGAKGFAFGTQWHPEYKAAENPDSVKLFEAYGDAVRAYVRQKSEPHPERTVRVA
ncbi:MAG: gamma-glutamyl-gamma-aminobutyrate hydrolase family protein [Hyphomicrobiales bacterium]